MNWYTTREAFKASTEIESTYTTKDARIDDCIEGASREVDGLCSFPSGGFFPSIATEYFDWPYKDMAAVNELPLDLYLLTLTALTADNGAKVIAPANVFLEPRRLGPPYTKIAISKSAGDFFSNFGTEQQAIAVTGTWGYSSATKPTSTLNGAINASVTAIVMTSVTLVGVGDTILIDSEAMFVSEKAGSTLTVERAVNGTTAASHLTGATVLKYAPPADIAKIVRAMAVNEYHLGQGGWTGQAGGAEGMMETRNVILQKLIDRTVRRYKLPTLGRA